MLPPDPSSTARERQLCALSAVDYVAMRRAGSVSCEEYARALVKRAQYYRYMNQWICEYASPRSPRLLYRF